MKFSEMRYERPSIEAVETSLRELISKFSGANSADEQKTIIDQINNIRFHVLMMNNLCHIRNTINTQDEFYKQEKRFFDQNMPVLEGVEADYYRALIASPFRAELELEFGRQLFRIAEMAVKTFAPEIVEDLQLNNELSTEYNALIASAQIPFDGQELTLSQLGKYLNIPDRSMRKAAHEAKYAFFESNENKLDEIYDELVRTRTNMARKQGYKTFTELGYARLNRTDYNPEMVAMFRDQVHTYIVPLAEKLKERQRRRIGVDILMYYDEGFHFTSGNPTPKGDPEWIVQNGKRMYEELSPETEAFFNFMVDNELMDLLSRKGKRVGGYCTVIPGEKAPFIFANFNGTAHDVTVLTHEAGHAFMGYMARDINVPEYMFPTLEAAEIHSMSMEFFTWDWMNLFFKEDTNKFKFEHLSGSITTISYLVTVDEFQHFVYDNPDASPAERKAAWRAIERKYIPHRNYTGNDYLERGGYWHQQRHIFNTPFYYIDYALAQVCALQFWKRMNEDRESAWKDYLHLCKLAGSKLFLELVAEANLISPFDDACLASIIGDVEKWLDAVDDQAL
jgi:M3 family oligoendopeptidase